ncbi:hypothetical protein BDW62DRAFT_217284 [Aspergillus aurantiobrunneus]
MAPKVPVTLDYTLRDLYLDNNQDLNTVLIYYALQFKDHNALSPAKYTYGYTLQNDEDAASIAMAAKMVPQRYAFSAGQMPLVILDFDSNKQNGADHEICQKPSVYHTDVRRTFAQLDPDQQPSLTFASSPGSISLDAGAQIAVLLPTDCLSHLPHLVHPETHYEMLSKRGLALSGLPTPPSQVIDTCLVGDDPVLLEQEIGRILDMVDQRPLPFMVKLPQSISGIGVFPITTQAERDRVKTLLSEQLGAMLRQVNTSNHHLYPCSVVLQDRVPGPVVCLSLFVTRDGQPRFVACCEQIFDQQGHWSGGRISYKQQDCLRENFAAVAEKVAAFLHGKGYHGPAGVDILTDDGSGEQLVIDLNVRVPGTFHLGPLMGHFTGREMFEAAMVTGDVSCSRDVFEERFAREIGNGSLILSGWVHGKSGLASHAAITVGARDACELDAFLGRIRALFLHA